MKNKLISGKITSIFPDDINTDDIIPAWTLQESTDRGFFAKYAFDNYDPEFVKRSAKSKANIVVAGKNFACGSSREQAVYALQGNNVVAVIAETYPDIFYRNALNNGLVLIVLPDTSVFNLGDDLQIDILKGEIIVNNNKKIKFEMNDDEKKIFAQGGVVGRVRSDLEDRLTGRFKKVRSYYKAKVISKKGQTIVEKIVSDHIGRPVYAGDKVERLPIDILFFNEVIAPPAIKEFQEFFTDIFKKHNKKAEVFDPKKIFFIPDHTVPSSSVAVSEGIDLMERFAQEQGIKCYKEGDGIEHVVLIEDGYICPGQIVLGTDSHTDTNGALNTLAFGVGTTDATYAMAVGFLYDFVVPETIRINLKGKFQKGVYSKDLILHIIGKLGVDGAVKKVVEFGGTGLKNLSMDARTTIANMCVEMGARTAIFDYDNTLEEYLKDRAQFEYRSYQPDKDAKYAKIMEVNLSKIEPCVAFPHKPSNVSVVTKLRQYMKKTQRSDSADLAKVNTLKITDAFLGACTNGRYEDFVEAAKIVKGRKVADHVNFVVIPASRKVYNRLLREGILEIFAEAGANIESSNCGPCFGKHMGVVGKGAQMISSSNRNYIGRMGSKDAKIFLASPVTVAASAVAGEITDPRKYLR
ncbi:MAG: hypothetical protein KatS3mg091_347 [Patescibacteria group bacterium]|nr:MAG: hypothetical protein KatS3mg091_347 [Patescibacteria group bacterium]